MDGRLSIILSNRNGDVWSGEWHSETETSISNNGEIVYGREGGIIPKGDVVMGWSSEGIVLNPIENNGCHAGCNLEESTGKSRLR